MKLNLGCGNQKKEGFIGVDKFPCDAVEIIADLTRKLPFEDETVDEVFMDNVIEHIIDIPSLLSEISRICRKGAKVTIYTPHFASHASWRDPTHIHHLSYFSMDHLEKNNVSHYMAQGFRVTERSLSFGGIMGNIGRFIFCINPRSYESNWCFIFRPSTLKFVLTKK